jgi:two-component system OmpR family sensor kinase
VAKLPLERGDVAIPERVPDPVPTTEVGQVGLAVNAMLDHVESSLQTRADTEDRLRRFVSDAGHELRTPLAAVRGYAELMRRGAASDPEQARHAAQRIESAGARMGTLVDDLLLLASLDEERPLARDVIDLHALVDEAVAEAATAGPDHEWSVDAPETPVRVVGDPVRLHQAVANLLANARSHTPDGTSVTLTLSHDERTAVIEVRDDGPGFPENLLPRVTERFARGDASRARATGGSGLGLAIVKAIAEAHGGTVTVANAVGGGGLVRIVLPAAEAVIPPSAVVEAAPAPLA